MPTNLLKPSAIWGVALVVVPLHAVESGEADPTPIEEIVVTATLREDTLGSTASSVGVVTADEIAARGAAHLEEILAAVPNVNYASGASRARYYQIRGIGERGQFDEPLNSSVGLVVDGVDLSGIGTVAMLTDVEQVEVLRGPRGTLYGANALAGLINVVLVQHFHGVDFALLAIITNLVLLIGTIWLFIIGVGLYKGISEFEVPAPAEPVAV